jgi:hypothetical protein
MCAQNEIESCTHCVPPTPLHKPVEGDALEHREHEQRTEEHDVRFANRGS